MSKKIRTIDSKIEKLLEQKKEVLKKRNSEILDVLSCVEISHLDDALLAGILMDAKEKLGRDEKQKEAWQKQGKKFLRAFKALQKHAA